MTNGLGDSARKEIKMKVRVWIEQEVEATVTVQDAIEELCAMPAAADRQTLITVLNRCIGALRHVPDDVLAQLEPKARQIVADAMREQAMRYDSAEVSPNAVYTTTDKPGPVA